MATSGAALAIYVGDYLVEVNGETEYEVMRQKLKYESSLELRFVRSGEKELAGSKVHDETDDEAEELRAALLAAQEARRKDFCVQATRCFEALPSALQATFGAAGTTRRISSGVDLRDCLSQFSMVDALEDDYKPVYSCTTCKTNLGHHTFASRRLFLWPAGLPPILTIQLKRFRRCGGDFVKSATSVVLPAELDLRDSVLTDVQFESLQAHVAAGMNLGKLAEEMKAQRAGSLLYELYALCEHQGSQMEDGHYVAYVNSGPSLAREEWFGMSDTTVWKCDRGEVLKGDAYIAFYRRVDVYAQASAVQEASEADSKDRI